jgi:PAS domain S-box-containing protein
MQGSMDSAARIHVVPLQDDVGGLDTAERAHERQLIDAAVAVNGAADLDEAFAVLTETALSLLGADRTSVVVWDANVQRGVVHASAGAGAEHGPREVGPGEEAYQAAVTGRPLVTRSTPVNDGEPASTLALSHLCCRVSVPVLFEGLPRMTFDAGWRGDQDEAKVQCAIWTLQTLGTLTRIAYRTEQERNRSRDRAQLDAVLESVGDGVIVLTPQGRLANAAARRLLGIGPDVEPRPELVSGRTLDGRPLGLDETPSAVAWRTGEPAHLRLRITSGDGVERVLDASGSPIKADDGSTIGAVTLFRDVTAEHNEGLVLERFREQLFDAMPTALAIVDPQTRAILTVNRLFCELTGYDADEAIGLTPPYPWWVRPEDFADADWAPGEGTVRIETRFRRRDGRVVPIELTRFVVHDSAGRPAATVALISDLSERRRFEQQIVQSGKLAAIGELAAGVAHEINNPLFAILGLVEFLIADAEPGTRTHERLSLIERTGLEIKDIVRALLDFAREPSEERTVVSLSKVVQQTIDLVRRTSLSKDIEIVERYPREQCLVEGSRNQLKQILLNLLSNAQQAMPTGGTVVVSVEQEDDWLVVKVEDTGPGIPAEVLPHVFDPFFTTKRELGGTGLGLAISLSIANRHGGDLTVQTQPGRGTSVYLRLPAGERTER